MIVMSNTARSWADADAQPHVADGDGRERPARHDPAVRERHVEHLVRREARDQRLGAAGRHVEQRRVQPQIGELGDELRRHHRRDERLAVAVLDATAGCPSAVRSP